jgi:sugar phosphate isomerase/epimerase
MKLSPNPFEPLRLSAKRCFPFALACPSFIYRAGYTENVARLAPFVDEVELLFFESRFDDSLPTPELVRELERLGHNGEITYNVHLPTDIYPGHPQASRRRRAVNVLRDMLARLAPLAPRTFTLHLNRDAGDADIARWQADTLASLQRVLADGISGRRISIENITDDLSTAAPVIETLDLSVCMDMGHLMVQQRSLEAFFDRWRERITIVHLHGVDGRRDHQPLDRLADGPMQAALRLLHGFGGVVCLEVFSRAALEASLARMLEMREGWERG